jgi:hypothetical protein
MCPKLVPFIALTTVAVLGSACGGGAESSTAAVSSAAAASSTRGTVSACSLLTAEDIQAVTRATITQSKAEAHGSVGTCHYQAGNELMPVVSLVLAPGMPKVGSSSEMAAWRSGQGTSWGDIKVVIEPVDGLGAPAIRNEVEGTGLVTVEVAVKGMLLDVTTSGLEQSKALATKAMARLP